MRAVQLKISDFGFEMQDSSNFTMSSLMSAGFVKYINALRKEGNQFFPLPVSSTRDVGKGQAP
jgi:hypothetical protein